MNQSEIELYWPPAPATPVLAPDALHVWAVPLDVPAAALGLFAQVLSTAEKTRSEAFRFEHLRNRYISGRGALRIILSKYLDVSPGAIEFVLGTMGKPALSMPIESEIQFNLAHSDGLALCAVTRAGIVGVDVEFHREVREMDHLVERFFSRREAGQFRQLQAGKKPEAFFNLWTRKEALLKATGAGISGGLNQVEVTFLQNEVPHVLAVPEGWPSASSWSLHTFIPARNFTGAAALNFLNSKIDTWRFT